MRTEIWQALHNKVIHERPFDYTDEELMKEEKFVRNANNAMLNLVCKQCFPLLNLPKSSPREWRQYSLFYPEIHTIVDAEEWNNRLAEK